MKLLVLMIVIFFIHIITVKNRNERRNAVFQGTVQDNGETENAVVIKQMMQGMKQWHQLSIINFVIH